MASAIGWMLSMLEHMKIVKPPNQSEAEARLRQEARLKPLIAGSARDEAAMLRADEAAQTWRRPGGIPINESESLASVFSSSRVLTDLRVYHKSHRCD